MMNQASQQSNNLDKLITQLKQLWHIEHNEQDSQAQAIIQAYAQSINGNLDNNSSNINPEEFAIQKKVLAKTREKIEALQKQLEALEAK